MSRAAVTVASVGPRQRKVRTGNVPIGISRAQQALVGYQQFGRQRGQSVLPSTWVRR